MIRGVLGVSPFFTQITQGTARFWVTGANANFFGCTGQVFRCFFAQRIESTTVEQLSLSHFLLSWVKFPRLCGFGFFVILGHPKQLVRLGRWLVRKSLWLDDNNMEKSGELSSLLVISDFWVQVFQISQHALPHLQRVKQLQLLRCLHHVMPISCSEQNYASVVSPPKKCRLVDHSSKLIIGKWQCVKTNSTPFLFTSK